MNDSELRALIVDNSTIEQRKRILKYPTIFVDPKDFAEFRVLSKWLSFDFPGLSKSEISWRVTAIFHYLRKEGIIIETGNKRDLDDRYGEVIKNRLFFHHKGYEQIKKLMDFSKLRKITPNGKLVPTGYEYLTHLCKTYLDKNETTYLYRQLIFQGYLRKLENGYQPIDENSPYFKCIIDKRRNKTYTLFREKLFMELYNKVQNNKKQPKQYYSLPELVKQHGYTPTNPWNDKILRNIKKFLSPQYMQKCDTKWIFTEEGLNCGMGINIGGPKSKKAYYYNDCELLNSEIDNTLNE